MLAKHEWKKQTAFNVAAQYVQREVLQKLWEWSTEKLSAEEVRKLLLAKEDAEETAFHFAAQHVQKEVLQ